MLTEKDWLMRIIDQLSQAIIRVLQLRETEDYEEAMEVLERLFVDDVRLPAFNWKLFDQRLPDYLGDEGDQIALLRRIFVQRAEIEWDRDHHHDAVRCEQVVEACNRRLEEMSWPDPFAELDK